MKRILIIAGVTATALLSATAVYAASPDAAIHAVKSCCAFLAACCGGDGSCCP